ncbi:MAG: hypothetical protein ABSD21_11255 [Rhizomicrobium sp.]|jgi:hypothetical protein
MVDGFRYGIGTEGQKIGLGQHPVQQMPHFACRGLHAGTGEDGLIGFSAPLKSDIVPDYALKETAMTRPRWLRAPISTMTVACVAVVLTAASALAAPASAVRPSLPVQKVFPPSYSLSFQLTCGAYMAPNSVIFYVALVNKGPGTVPAGTKVHWSMSIQPGPRDGDYTFASPLAPNDHVWMLGALPITYKSGPCMVTVL